MEYEKVNGRILLTGGMLPVDKILPGQKWAPADGGDYEVIVTKVADGVVTYHNDVYGIDHEKDSFSFQCRYCLVIEQKD